MGKPRDHDEFDESELIDEQFESIIAGLSLDQSSPRTYLDDLEAIDRAEKFTPPAIPKVSLIKQLKSARDAIIRWKNNRNPFPPEDGTAL